MLKFVEMYGYVDIGRVLQVDVHVHCSTCTVLNTRKFWFSERKDIRRLLHSGPSTPPRCRAYTLLHIDSARIPSLHRCRFFWLDDYHKEKMQIEISSLIKYMGMNSITTILYMYNIFTERSPPNMTEN